MSICILKHIEKKYRNGEEIEPLIDIDLEVDRGEFIIIKGPSGTGKSTLLYVIGTLLQADSGELYIDGQNVIHPAAITFITPSDENGTTRGATTSSVGQAEDSAGSAARYCHNIHNLRCARIHQLRHQRLPEAERNARR